MIVSCIAVREHKNLGVQNVYSCPKHYTKLPEQSSHLPKSVPTFTQIKNLGDELHDRTS